MLSLGSNHWTDPPRRHRSCRTPSFGDRRTLTGVGTPGSKRGPLSTSVHHLRGHGPLQLKSRSSVSVGVREVYDDCVPDGSTRGGRGLCHTMG